MFPHKEELQNYPCTIEERRIYQLIFLRLLACIYFQPFKDTYTVCFGRCNLANPYIEVYNVYVLWNKGAYSGQAVVFELEEEEVVVVHRKL